MEVKFFAVRDKKGVVYDFDRYKDENRKAIEAYFNSPEEPDEIKLTNDAPDYDFKYTFDELSNSLCFFLRDLKDSSSSLSQLCASYKGENEIDKKICIFEDMFPKLVKRWLDPGYGDNSENREKMVIYYGSKGQYFSVYIPSAIMRENGLKWSPIDDEVFLGGLSWEMLSEYIIPMYYYDLGTWDRKFVREDPVEMENLRKDWFRSCKPLLD